MDAVGEVCGCVSGKQRRNIRIFALIFIHKITNKTNLDLVVCLS